LELPSCIYAIILEWHLSTAASYKLELQNSNAQVQVCPAWIYGLQERDIMTCQFLMEKALSESQHNEHSQSQWIV